MSMYVLHPSSDPSTLCTAPGAGGHIAEHYCALRTDVGVALALAQGVAGFQSSSEGQGWPVGKRWLSSPRPSSIAQHMYPPLSKHGLVQTQQPRVSAILGLFWNHHFCGSNPMWFVVLCRLQEGSVWVAKCWCSCNSMCSCALGCVLACCFVLPCSEEAD